MALYKSVYYYYYYFRGEGRSGLRGQMSCEDVRSSAEAVQRHVTRPRRPDPLRRRHARPPAGIARRRRRPRPTHRVTYLSSRRAATRRPAGALRRCLLLTRCSSVTRFICVGQRAAVSRRDDTVLFTPLAQIRGTARSVRRARFPSVCLSQLLRVCC